MFPRKCLWKEFMFVCHWFIYLLVCLSAPFFFVSFPRTSSVSSLCPPSCLFLKRDNYGRQAPVSFFLLGRTYYHPVFNLCTYPLNYLQHFTNSLTRRPVIWLRGLYASDLGSLFQCWIRVPVIRSQHYNVVSADIPFSVDAATENKAWNGRHSSLSHYPRDTVKWLKSFHALLWWNKSFNTYIS